MQREGRADGGGLDWCTPNPTAASPQVSGSWGALVLSWCLVGHSGHRGSLGQAAELLGVSVLATLSLRLQTQSLHLR